MKYDIEHIELKDLLISCFLIDAESGILDVSYNYSNKTLVIQVVLLNGHIISFEKMSLIRKRLIGYNWKINEIYISRAHFNETIDTWLPKNYSWLSNVLFSLKEIL